MKDLIKVANRLNDLGLTKEANELLKIIRTAGIPTKEWEDDYRLDQEFAKEDNHGRIGIKYTGLNSAHNDDGSSDPDTYGLDLAIMDEEELTALLGETESNAESLKQYMARNNIEIPKDWWNDGGPEYTKLKALQNRIYVIKGMINKERHKTGANLR